MARIFRVIVPVTDIEAAADFYEGILGSRGARVSKGRHYFDCEGVILACFDPGADGDGYVAAPNPEPLYLAVSDLQATHAACRDAGAEFSDELLHGDQPLGEIAQRPWGETSFYIADPFGNRICFVQRETEFRG